MRKYHTFLDERKQRDALPVVLFAVEVDDKVARVEIDNRRCDIREQMLPARWDVSPAAGGEDSWKFTR